MVFITGELGEGKSLCAVGRIRDYLKRGLPVATNLDLYLHNMLGKTNKTARVIRLPDKPLQYDLEIIGRGNKTKNEDLNGLVVLDELGTWLNARTWNDKSRQDLLNYFLHIRKCGWDLLLLVQDIDLIDKQFRTTIAKYHCKCSRTDNWNLPFIGFIFRLFFREKLPFPKTFLVNVLYKGVLSVDKWVYFGKSLYNCYDTNQKFKDDYKHGAYSYLPPSYIKYKGCVHWTKDKILQLTRIVWRKYSRVVVFGIGFFMCLILFLVFNVSANFFGRNVGPVAVTANDSMPEYLKNCAIAGYTSLPDRMPVYRFVSGDNVFTSSELLQAGFNVVNLGSARCKILKGANYVYIPQ